MDQEDIATLQRASDAAGGFDRWAKTRVFIAENNFEPLAEFHEIEAARGRLNETIKCNRVQGMSKENKTCILRLQIAIDKADATYPLVIHKTADNADVCKRETAVSADVCKRQRRYRFHTGYLKFAERHGIDRCAVGLGLFDEKTSLMHDFATLEHAADGFDRWAKVRGFLADNHFEKAPELEEITDAFSRLRDHVQTCSESSLWEKEDAIKMLRCLMKCDKANAWYYERFLDGSITAHFLRFADLCGGGRKCIADLTRQELVLFTVKPRKDSHPSATVT